MDPQIRRAHMSAAHAKLTMLIASGALVMAFACKGKNESYGTDTARAATATKDTTAAATTAPAAGGLTDANIAAILDAANESDSAFGSMAVKKGKSVDVKQDRKSTRLNSSHTVISYAV